MNLATTNINTDLVREILARVKESEPTIGTLMRIFAADNVDADGIREHIRILVKSDFINETFETRSQEDLEVELKITERGIEFYKLLENEDIYWRIYELYNERPLNDLRELFSEAKKIASMNNSLTFDSSSANDSKHDEPPEIEQAATNDKAQPAPDSAQAEQKTDSDSSDEDANVATYSPADQPTINDDLGFELYVKAIATFLNDERTKGPLTLSIEGEWGTGKSSFMLQLEKALKDLKPDVLTVHFNAWRYDKEDALWAAFATRVVKELSKKVSFLHRLKAKWYLFRSRYNWKKGWFSFLSLGLVAVSLFYLAILLINNYFKNPSDFAPFGNWLTQAFSKDGADLILRFLTLTFAGYIILYVLALRKINDFLINPLATDFKKHHNAPDYQQRATFLDEFHEDFKRVLEAYAGKGDDAQKVFVFIDDLDRCEVPKSADLMQALNLMISDAPQLFFIIGMDREKVAAGLAVKYEKLLGYVFGENSALAKNDPANALDFGFRFVEKFIQVPFKVPQPRPANIKVFLDKIGASSKNEQPKMAAQAERKGRNERIPSTVAVDATHSPPETKPTIKDPSENQPRLPERVNVEISTDSEVIGTVVESVAEFFEYNPRRIKQFFNVFRLKIYIGNETGLFAQPEDSKLKRINLHKLGRFVAISLQYPLLIADLDENPKLLDELQNIALNEKSPTGLFLPKAGKIAFWSDKPRLMTLLKKYLIENQSETNKDKYSLQDIDVNKLLQVSPTSKSRQTNEKA